MTRNTRAVLARDVREGLDDVEHAAGKAGRRVAADARQLAAEAAAEGRVIAARTVSEGRALAAKAVDEARRRPGLTVAIAAAAAAVIGLLMIPRRRR